MNPKISRRTFIQFSSTVVPVLSTIEFSHTQRLAHAQPQPQHPTRGVRGGSTFPLPPGIYTLQCTDVEMDVTSRGNPIIRETFRVIRGEFTGRELHSPLSLNFVLKTVLDRMKVPYDSEGFVLEDFIGQEVTVVVEKHNYVGTD